MKPLKVLYIFSFFLALQVAVTTYVNSSFLLQFIKEKNVGLIFSLGAFLGIFILMILPKIVMRLGNFRLNNLILFLMLISLVGLFLAKSAASGIGWFIVYIIANIMIVFSRDIFIEKYAREESTGRTRGIFLTFVNFGFLLSPLIAGLAAEKSFNNVYLLALLFLLPAFFIIRPFKQFHDPHYKPPVLKEVFRKFREDISVFKIYLINFILQFFYVWMVVFMPIYLNRHIGFDFKEIGIIFTIMLLPFVIIQFPIGRWADKIGEKEILTVGIIICGLATLAVPWIQSANLLLWAFVLFMTRVGAATIEAMTEIYFFKKVEAKDSEMISFFRNTAPVAAVLAPVIASIILGFSSFQMLFAILGLIVLAALYLNENILDTN